MSSAQREKSGTWPRSEPPPRRGCAVDDERVEAALEQVCRGGKADGSGADDKGG
jgi:hypothetical protein